MSTDLRSVHYETIAETLRGKCALVHAALSNLPPQTPTELAEWMKWQVTSVRPRLTQLRAAGLVELTGLRRNHEHVVRAVSRQEAERRAREAEAARLSQAAEQLPLLVSDSAAQADPMPDDEGEERCRCDRCGGDGFIEYNDGDGGDWGEDCPSEQNHLIVCRACRGTGNAQ